MKPKYSVEQILEAVEASHLPLVVKGVDADKGALELLHQVELELLYPVETIAVVSDENELLILHTSPRCSTVLEQVVLSSLKTALHILFNSNEVIY